MESSMMMSRSKALSIMFSSVLPRIKRIEEVNNNPPSIKVSDIPTRRFLSGGLFLNVSVCAFSNALIIDIIPLDAKYRANRKPIDKSSGRRLFARSSRVSKTISPALPGSIDRIWASSVGKKSLPPSGRNEKKYSEKKGNKLSKRIKEGNRERKKLKVIELALVTTSKRFISFPTKTITS